jgi:hypothetical protein
LGEIVLDPLFLFFYAFSGEEELLIEIPVAVMLLSGFQDVLISVKTRTLYCYTIAGSWNAHLEKTKTDSGAKVGLLYFFCYAMLKLCGKQTVLGLPTPRASEERVYPSGSTFVHTWPRSRERYL